MLKIIAAWGLRLDCFGQKAEGQEPGVQLGPAKRSGPGAQLGAAGPPELEERLKTDPASAAAVAEAPADSRAAAEPATPAGTAEVADIAGAAGSHRLPLAQLHRPYERD